MWCGCSDRGAAAVSDQVRLPRGHEATWAATTLVSFAITLRQGAREKRATQATRGATAASGTPEAACLRNACVALILCVLEQKIRLLCDSPSFRGGWPLHFLSSETSGELPSSLLLRAPRPAEGLTSSSWCTLRSTGCPYTRRQNPLIDPPIQIC